MKRLTHVGVTTVLLLSGCAWVQLTNEGEQVSVIQPELAKTCKRIGQTESTVKDKVGVFERNDNKVADELQTLARNAAGRMGGDAVMAAGPVEEGKQLFYIYDCIER